MMSTYSSRQRNSQDMMEPLWILWYIVMVGILMISGLNTNMQSGSLSRALGSQSQVYVDTPFRANVSFASDNSYWSANCSHGWVGNPMCNAIAIRAQSCAFGSISTYCSNYKDYLLQFNK